MRMMKMMTLKLWMKLHSRKNTKLEIPPRKWRRFVILDSLAQLLKLVSYLHFIFQNAAKLYIEPQGTGVNGSIYPRFDISHIHLFALIVARPFTKVVVFLTLNLSLCSK